MITNRIKKLKKITKNITPTERVRKGVKWLSGLTDQVSLDL